MDKKDFGEAFDRDGAELTEEQIAEYWRERETDNAEKRSKRDVNAILTDQIWYEIDDAAEYFKNLQAQRGLVEMEAKASNGRSPAFRELSDEMLDEARVFNDAVRSVRGTVAAMLRADDIVAEFRGSPNRNFRILERDLRKWAQDKYAAMEAAVDKSVSALDALETYLSDPHPRGLDIAPAMAGFQAAHDELQRIVGTESDDGVYAMQRKAKSWDGEQEQAGIEQMKADHRTRIAAGESAGFVSGIVSEGGYNFNFNRSSKIKKRHPGMSEFEAGSLERIINILWRNKVSMSAEEIARERTAYSDNMAGAAVAGVARITDENIREYIAKYGDDALIKHAYDDKYTLNNLEGEDEEEGGEGLPGGIRGFSRHYATESAEPLAENSVRLPGYYGIVRYMPGDSQGDEETLDALLDYELRMTFPHAGSGAVEGRSETVINRLVPGTTISVDDMRNSVEGAMQTLQDKGIRPDPFVVVSNSRWPGTAGGVRFSYDAELAPAGFATRIAADLHKFFVEDYPNGMNRSTEDKLNAFLSDEATAPPRLGEWAQVAEPADLLPVLDGVRELRATVAVDGRKQAMEFRISEDAVRAKSNSGRRTLPRAKFEELLADGVVAGIDLAADVPDVWELAEMFVRRAAVQSLKEAAEPLPQLDASDNPFYADEYAGPIGVGDFVAHAERPRRLLGRVASVEKQPDPDLAGNYWNVLVEVDPQGLPLIKQLGLHEIWTEGGEKCVQVAPAELVLKANSTQDQDRERNESRQFKPGDRVYNVRQGNATGTVREFGGWREDERGYMYRTWTVDYDHGPAVTEASADLDRIDAASSAFSSPSVSDDDIRQPWRTVSEAVADYFGD